MKKKGIAFMDNLRYLNNSGAMQAIKIQITTRDVPAS